MQEARHVTARAGWPNEQLASQMVWLAGCFFASQFRWRHYWWRWFWVALLQPGFASWWEHRPPCLIPAPRLPRWAM